MTPSLLSQSFLVSTTSLLPTAPRTTIHRHGAAERSGAAPPGQQQRGGQEERRGTWCKGLLEGVAGGIGGTRLAVVFCPVAWECLLALLLLQPAEGRAGRVDLQVVAAGPRKAGNGRATRVLGMPVYRAWVWLGCSRWHRRFPRAGGTGLPYSNLCVSRQVEVF